MKRLLIGGFAITLLAWSGASAARAQNTPAAPAAAPVSSAPCTGDSVPDCVPSQKVVRPVVEKVPHSCISYDCKEEDYSYTKWAHIPILSRFCHDHCGNCDCCQNESEPCHDCGHARTRKVLIKIIETEPVATPKCKVERVPVCVSHPADPSCSPDYPENMVLTTPVTPAPVAPAKPIPAPAREK